MHAWMMMVALALPGAELAAAVDSTAAESVQPSEFASYEHTAAELAPQLETGTLLFNRGDCLAVRIYTASPYTHVAVVVMEDGEPVVYDSMNDVGVRRQSLCEYLVSQSPDELHVFHPQRPLTPEQCRGLAEYLDSQLGRPYAVRHHLTGRRNTGVHCSEYATDALMAIGLVHAERPPKVSPASLVTGITQANIYSTGVTVNLTPAKPAPPETANRCQRIWFDTKLCFTACCQKMSGWILCR